MQTLLMTYSSTHGVKDAPIT